MNKPRPFSGVYRDRNNLESLLESRTVRKAVLSTLRTSSQRDIRLALLEMELYRVLSQQTNLSWYARGSVSVVVYLSI